MQNYTGRYYYHQEGYFVYYLKEDYIWHRLDGPAVANEDGSIFLSTPEDDGAACYWINDQCIEPEDYWNHPEVRAYRNEMKLKKVLGLE